MRTKRILLAPLNWGLGHATRCIPIIRNLEKSGFEPVLASDGAALQLLKKEFPQFQTIELPAYNIRYSKKGKNLKWQLLLQLPHILKTIEQEKKVTAAILKAQDFCGIISDNRFGVYSEAVPSVYITHQLHVLSGATTFLTSRIHQRTIQKFDQCWIPDSPGKNNLSGYLGHLKKNPENLKYIGILSRFQKRDLQKVFDYMVLLSGPEPQRSLLEDILVKSFRNTTQKVLFVRGIFSEEEPENINPNISIKNVLYGTELENALNSSEVIISRPGYTTIMDLIQLQKKAFFIPTPGQPEQQYLAKRLQEKGMAPFCWQDKFELGELEKLKEYPALQDTGFGIDRSSLFSLFEGK